MLLHATETLDEIISHVTIFPSNEKRDHCAISTDCIKNNGWSKLEMTVREKVQLVLDTIKFDLPKYYKYFLILYNNDQTTALFKSAMYTHAKWPIRCEIVCDMDQ